MYVSLSKLYMQSACVIALMQLVDSFLIDILDHHVPSNIPANSFCHVPSHAPADPLNASGLLLKPQSSHSLISAMLCDCSAQLVYAVSSSVGPNSKNSMQSCGVHSVGSVGDCNPGPVTAQHITSVQPSDRPAGGAAAWLAAGSHGRPKAGPETHLCSWPGSIDASVEGLGTVQWPFPCKADCTGGCHAAALGQ